MEHKKSAGQGLVLRESANEWYRDYSASAVDKWVAHCALALWTIGKPIPDLSTGSPRRLPSA